MNKTKTPEDCAKYRRQKGIAQRIIKDAAKGHWQSYCSTMDKSTKLGSVWRMSKKMSGKTTGFRISHLTKDDILYKTDQDKANLLADVFAQASADSNHSAEFGKHKCKFEKDNIADFTDSSTSEEKKSSLNTEFSMSELKAAVRQCKNKSSPGADLVTYEMIKELPKDSLNVLLLFYNQVYSSGEMPSDWSHAVILPFQKPDKPPTDPGSYRPISLTSCLCKLMEKLVSNRFTWYLEKNKILNNAQTGFRKGRSTVDQIVKLQDVIHRYNKNKGFTLGVFLDFEKAYDMMWRTGLLVKLKKIGINGNMFSFISSFIRNRSMQVQVGTKLSETKTLENGTPQGSILSPILFLVMINDIDIGKESGVELSLFC